MSSRERIETWPKDSPFRKDEIHEHDHDQGRHTDLYTDWGSGQPVARYIGRHSTKRVAKAVLIGAIPPLMLRTVANPGGTPIEAFDQVIAPWTQRFPSMAAAEEAGK